MRKSTRLISHHQEERGGIAGIMFSMVVDEFGDGKMFYPFFRVRAAINAEVCF
jgi:hypothetical protein